MKRRKRKRYKARGTTLTDPKMANGLWGADYKGQFLLGNKKYCYPCGQNTHAATAEFSDTKKVHESSSTGHRQRNGITVFFKAKASSTKADRRGPGGSLFNSRWIAT